MPRLGVDPAAEDVAKTGRNNNVTFSSRIVAAQLEISETFRLTKPTSPDPNIQDGAIRRFHFRSVQRKNIFCGKWFFVRQITSLRISPSPRRKADSNAKS